MRRRKRRASLRTVLLAGAVVAMGAVALAWGMHHHRQPAASEHSSSSAASSSTSIAASALSAVRVTTLATGLPVPLQGMAAVVWNGVIYLLGGSGPQGFSAAIYAFTPRTGQLTKVGSLPTALHDAAAAALPDGILLCGGGQSTILPNIERWSGSGLASQVGALPYGLADVGAATVGSNAYCLGGYDGTTVNAQVFDITDGNAKAIATMPVAVRYGAVVGFGGRIWSAGGQTQSGQVTAAIQWAAPDGTSGQAGALPRAVARAVAAEIDGEMVVAGGCDANMIPSTADVWGIVPGTTAAVTRLGSLPTDLCWDAAAAVGGTMYVFGGTAGPTATTSSTIYAITGVMG